MLEQAELSGMQWPRFGYNHHGLLLAVIPTCHFMPQPQNGV